MRKKLAHVAITMVFAVAASATMLGAGSPEIDTSTLPSGQGIFQVGGLNNPGALWDPPEVVIENATCDCIFGMPDCLYELNHKCPWRACRFIDCDWY